MTAPPIISCPYTTKVTFLLPKFEPRLQSKLHYLFKVALAVLNIQCDPPAVGPRLPSLRRVCHSYSAREIFRTDRASFGIGECR